MTPEGPEKETRMQTNATRIARAMLANVERLAWRAIPLSEYEAELERLWERAVGAGVADRVAELVAPEVA